MSTFHCRICDVTFSDESGSKSHFVGKKHLLKLASFKNWQKKSECSIFVAGFLPGTSEIRLADYFSIFGPVESIVINKDKGSYGFVCYSTKQAVERVLSQTPHIFFGRRLVVNRRHVGKFNASKKKPDKKEEETLFAAHHDSLIEKLQSCSSVSEQLSVLYQLLPLGEVDFIERETLCAYLEKSLREFFPACKVHLYGSTLNGLGLKGCDVDIALSLCEEQHRYEPVESIGVPDPATVPNIVDLRQNRQLWRDLVRMPVNVQLKFVEKVLKRVTKECRRAVFIPSIRCPIVKFQYRQLSCDLSIGKRLVLYNTRLLWLYGELDRRVRVLGVMLRYWGKHCDLLGPRSRLTSYAFTLMIIFFLQTRSPPVIPSVEELTQLADPSVKRSIGGWDCSFCEDISKIPSSTNVQSSEELMKEFFSYYANFNFLLHVISLRKALILPKMSSELKDKKFQISAICIQDPFDLSHNLTSNIRDNLLVLMVDNFQNAAKICQAPNFASKLARGYWGVCRLFNSFIKPLEKKSAYLMTRPSCFEIFLKTDMLHTLYKDLPSVSSNAVKMAWLQKTCDLIQDVLEKALLFEYQIVECNFAKRQSQKKRSSDKSEGEEDKQCKHAKCDESYFSPSLEHEHTDSAINDIELFPVTGDSLVPQNDIKMSSDKSHVKDNTVLNCDELSSNTTQQKDFETFSQGESSEEASTSSCPSSETVLRKINCKIFYRTWVGRNAIRKSLILTDTNPLLKENAISQVILRRSGSKSEEPLFELDCAFGVKHQGGMTSLTVTLKPKAVSKSKEINAVRSFISSFVPKVVERLMLLEMSEKSYGDFQSESEDN